MPLTSSYHGAKKGAVNTLNYKVGNAANGTKQCFIFGIVLSELTACFSFEYMLLGGCKFKKVNLHRFSCCQIESGIGRDHWAQEAFWRPWLTR